MMIMMMIIMMTTTMMLMLLLLMIMMMMMIMIIIIIIIIINVRWPSGGPICTSGSTHMITCCYTENRSINTARASSVWRKCPGSWCVRLTHVWRGKIMTTLCVRNNARGRAILVERLLLVDTVISWFDLPFVDVGLNTILCGSHFTICLLIVNPNKVSSFT